MSVFYFNIKVALNCNWKIELKIMIYFWFLISNSVYLWWIELTIKWLKAPPAEVWPFLDLRYILERRSPGYVLKQKTYCDELNAVTQHAHVPHVTPSPPRGKSPLVTSILGIQQFHLDHNSHICQVWNKRII